MLIAYDWWNPTKWPILNVSFLFFFILTTVLALLAIPYGKRRPKGTWTSWGETMVAAVYVFGLFFLAFGVVPHQYIDYADKELHWNKSNVIFGPGGILKPQAFGGNFPFTMSYEAIRDTVVILIHLWFFALAIFLWSKWQKRGDGTPSTEVATSSFGRPLVRKG